MIFHKKGKKIQNPPTIYYNENEPNQVQSDALVSVLERYHENHPQPDCRSYKLLGIFLDEHLSLDYHVTHIYNKLTKSLYCIKQTKQLIPLGGLKALYFALIHSHLTYCTLIFSASMPFYHLKNLFYNLSSIICTPSNTNMHQLHLKTHG